MAKKIPGYTVDGVQQYSPENYDDQGNFLGPAPAPVGPDEVMSSRKKETKEGPSTLGRVLLALGEGVQGFADGVSVPNVAAGGGTDMFRGLSYALGRQQDRRAEREKMALQHEANLASAEQKRAMADWYTARPDLERKKVENAAAVNEDKSRLGWRKADIAGQNANSTAGYRTGMLGVANRNADTNAGYKGTMGDVAKTNAVTGANKLAVPFGMKSFASYDEVKDQGRLIPAEYADRSPVVNAGIENKEAATGLAKANTDLAGAKTDETKKRTALMDRAMQIRATLASAAMLGAQSSAQRAQIAKDVYGFEYKGEDENGNAVLFDEDGNAVIPKALMAAKGGEKIPAAMQTKVAQAHTIVGSGQELIGMIEQLAKENKIGPGMGRVQNVKAGFGFLEPDVKATVTELKNLASLLPAVHGQRGVTAKKDFEETIGGLEQKPESVIAAIQRIQAMSQMIIKDNQTVYHPAGGQRRAAPKGGQGGQGGQKRAYTVTSPDGKSTKVMQLTPAQAKYYQDQKATVVANGQ